MVQFHEKSQFVYIMHIIVLTVTVLISLSFLYDFGSLCTFAIVSSLDRLSCLRFNRTLFHGSSHVDSSCSDICTYVTMLFNNQQTEMTSLFSDRFSLRYVTTFVFFNHLLSWRYKFDCTSFLRLFIGRIVW